MSDAYVAIGLHMHQPPDNLRLLIEANEWEAEGIIRAYDRPSWYAHEFPQAALQIGFSGILLEQFRDPEIIDRYRRFVDIPEMLDRYRSAQSIEIIGMGYYHPVFPLIPPADWEEHLTLGRQLIEEVFGQSPKGFWPSEMAFSMEMIPALKKVGYQYVVVDHVHVKAEGKAEHPDFFKPYLASYDGATITVVPRNRDVSNAQESGMDPTWYINEVSHKLKEHPSEQEARLVCTWSDGENGGWFRRMDDNSGFFGYFFRPFIQQIESSEGGFRMIKLSDFVERYPANEKAHVQTGAWNVASTSGYDFSQWAGSEAQRQAIAALFRVSERYWTLQKSKEISADRLKKARQVLLEAETSCYLFWGDSWLPGMYQKLDRVREILENY